MSMKKYLDINSLINSDFYKKNQRLYWHMNILDYYKLYQSLYNLFEEIKLDKSHDVIFQLARTSIHNNVSIYIDSLPLFVNINVFSISALVLIISCLFFIGIIFNISDNILPNFILY